MLMIYLILLVWLVLFKLSFDLSSILTLHRRSINFRPFNSHTSEMVLNFIFFIPFGLLLSVNYKETSMWSKLAIVFLFSFTAELLQYTFAIGATDITDLINNTLGGLAGLILYRLSNRFISTQRLDKLIILCGAVLLVFFLGMHLSHWVRRG